MPRAEPGAIVGARFEILRIGGSGGMGVVYQARDRRDGRVVALKILERIEPAALDRFANEVEILSALEHPHIVGYISHGVEGGAPYVVMPWLEGTDLESRLEAGALTIEETLTIALGVGDALAYLHGRGLIHRDLKPSNLFLPGGDVARVQLIDLGITREGAAPTRAVTESGVLVGTPNFIAPEQARGDREIAPAADIFALGCVLFECLTGKRLFTGAHLMSILAKVLLEEAPRVSEIRPEVPAFLDDLVDRMVAKDPQKRPAHGAELLKWLSEPRQTAVRPLEALTSNERRVVTILVVALASSRGSEATASDELAAVDAPFAASSKVFGVQAHVLADRMAIVRAPERLGAADQAFLLMRFARHVVETQPRARIALTTGTTTTGARLPVGEAIDRAVTIVRSADGGSGVCVDDATTSLIATRFEVLDGRVIDERASLDPTRRLLGKPTSCVGRERELAILEATFAESANGGGPKVVLVTADAGAGKSRLQHEFERRLHGGGTTDVLVLQCRGDPFRSSMPYAMLAQAVRRAIGLGEIEPFEQAKTKLLAHVASHVAPADVANVGDFVGELVGVHFDDQGRLPLRAARQDAGAMADQIGRAFEGLVRGWCDRQPVVLVLDDLHWGHGTCVKLLDRALWKLTGARLFVLALARPEVHARFPALLAKRNITEVRLPPLARRASAKLVHEVLGGDVPAEEIERLTERSEGNAFYLEELIRAAAAPARPSRQASLRPRGLPEALLAVAQARLERLESNARRVLRAASVFGDVFWLEGVGALVGGTPAEVAPVLATLIAEEAIIAAEHPRLAGVSEFTFRHALLQGTAYATLTEEDRALGHRLAAAWLRDVLEDDDIVARHWLKGGEPKQAAAAFRSAAERRMRRAQPDAAARSITRALVVLDAESAPAVPACIALLADALAVTRRVDVEDVIAGLEGHAPAYDASAPHAARAWVLSVVDRALGFLRAGAHPALVVTLASAACAVGALGDSATAKDLLDEASSGAAGDPRALRGVRFASARVASWSVNASAIVELLDEDTLPDDPAARHEGLSMLAWAVVTVGGHAALEHGLDLVRKAEATRRSRSEGVGGADPLEDHLAQVQTAKARTLCFGFAGEHARSAEAAEEGVALARRAGLRFEECAQLHNAAEQYCLSGNLERSRTRALESSVMAREIGADLLKRPNDMLLAYLDRDAERLTRIAETMSATGHPSLDLFAHYWLGRLLAETRAPGARLALERARRIAGDLAIRHVQEDCARTLAGLDAE